MPKSDYPEKNTQHITNPRKNCRGLKVPLKLYYKFSEIIVKKLFFNRKFTYQLALLA